MDDVLKHLDAAAKAYHKAAGKDHPARVEQFDSHFATVRMVVEHTAAEAAIEKEQ